MKANAMLRCARKDNGCVGTLGAWVEGSFYPAAHLVAGRDLYMQPHGALVVRCPLCKQEHEVWFLTAKNRLVLTAKDA
jgi:LSD1 subclass zinc finger protein